MEYGIVLIAKGSPNGEKAAQKAAQLAKEKSINTIHILFVNDTEFFKGGGFVHLEKELEKSLDNIGTIIMDKLEKVIKQSNSNIDIKRIELKGNTAEEILKFVNENKVDTLIIPKEERGPIEKSLTGGDIEPFFNEIKKKVKNLIIVER